MSIILSYALRLMLVCVLASGLLAYVYNTTAKKIKLNAEHEKTIKVKSVLQESVEDIREFESNGIKFYRGFEGGSLAGTVIEAEANGYGGPVKLLVGIDAQGSIIDIAFVSHKETPGLGSKMELEGFKGQFRSRKAENVFLKNDAAPDKPKDSGVDAITAATISSRAVVNAVKSAFEKYKEANN